MSTLKFKNVFLSDAKEILALCYHIDRSGAYNNDFCYVGSHITGTITKNEDAFKASIKEKFDVVVTSSFLNIVSMNEIFDEYLFAI